MAPSCLTSITLVVTFILLIFNVTHVVALPNQVPRQPFTHDVLDARAPAPETENAHSEAVDLSADGKKEGKNFFKELGSFLSGFDPVDVFRMILGGLLGFKDAPDADSTSVAVPSLSTTVIITATPVEIPLSALGTPVLPLVSSLVPNKTVYTTVKTTVTTKVTASKSSTKKPLVTLPAGEGEIFSALPFYPDEPLSSPSLDTTEIPLPDFVIASESLNVEEAVPTETGDSGIVFSILPFFPPKGPYTEPSLTPVTTLIDIPVPTGVIDTPLVNPFLTVLPPVGTEAPEAEETFSILPYIPEGENLSDNITFAEPTGIAEDSDPFEVITEPVAPVPEPTETFSILPFIEPGENLSDNVTYPVPTEVTDEPVITEPVAPVPEPTEIFSILPFIEPGEHLSDNVTYPEPTEVIDEPVITEPVAPVPNPTETFSILPFIEPGENLSDNVTWPTPTDVEISVPELSIPVITLPAEQVNPFLTGSVSNDIPEPTEVDVPVQTQTGSPDLDNFPYPLLEFVNGTYVSPTKKPHFATPVLHPPKWSIVTRSAKKTSKGKKSKATSTKAPLTKPIVLPPPLVRPTNFPLNQTFFGNETKGIKTSIIAMKSTRPFILTNPLRPTIEPVPLPLPLPKPFPLLNFTKSFDIIPVIKPTRPLILTNPLRPTNEVFETLDLGKKTTTKTVKSRSTTYVTVLVVPTPVVDDGIDVSILGVDTPADQPVPSDTGFKEPGLFPIVDDDVSFPIPSVVRTEVLVPSISLNISIADIPTPTPEPDYIDSALVDPLFVRPTTSIPDVSVSIATLNVSVSIPALSVSSLNIESPLLDPTPTPRTFATVRVEPTGSPTPALPSGFSLPTPVIDSSNVTFTPNNKRLSEICADPKIKTVTLPLLQKWYGPNAYPSLQKYPGCVAPNPRQAIQAPGLLNCTELGTEVQACQKAGKRILLGVKVDDPAAVNGNLKYGEPNTLGLKLPLSVPPGPFLGRPGHPFIPLAGNLSTIQLDGKTIPAPNLFDMLHTPTGIASTLFSLFGEGHAERADLRPLGPDTPSAVSPDSIKWIVKPLGEEVVLDGFDVRIPGQWKGTAQAALVQKFVEALRTKVQTAWIEGGGKKGGINDLGVDGPGVVVSGYI